MASNNGFGQGRDPNRRRQNASRRRGLLNLEALENRRLLDGGVNRSWLTNPSNLLDTQHGPMANLGPPLVKIWSDYQGYKQAFPQLDTATDRGFASSPLNTLSGQYRFDGNRVGVDIRVFGDLRQAQGDLSVLGMKIEASDSYFNLVEGTIAIDKLPQLAALGNVISGAAIPRAVLGSQGVAVNQAETALAAAQARTAYGVNGAGITIGVLSDSANVAPNTAYPGTPNPRQPGLQGSIDTGDLPADARIITVDGVLQDGPAGSSDEGRAMMEQIYDIAPGAKLLFASAFNGPVSFANNIRALAANGATVITDDVFYLGSNAAPFYQDGVIARAVADVTTQNNVVYVGIAGNSGGNSQTAAVNGYDSPTFGINTVTVAGTSGRFVDFDPSAGTLYQMPITVNAATTVMMQFDQAAFSASGNAVTSDVTINFYDANGALVVQGNANPIATQLPEQYVTVPASARSFSVQVRSGPDIGRFRVREWGLSAWQQSLNVAQTFGNQASIFYPTMFGQSVVETALGVGAVPWFNVPPIGSQNPLRTEDFSGTGPATILFDVNGNRLAVPEVRLKPDFAGTDGNNTSFFGGLGGIPPGVASNNYNLPNFFGTSSAAPNVAAVAALMRQLAPNATVADINAALKGSAVSTPLNTNNPAAPRVSTGVGLWDPQGGYGLINAVQALAAVDLFRVNSIVPGGGQTVNSMPSTLTVTFNNPVNVATLQASDLVFTGLPAGVTVTVGQPTVNPNNPNVAVFPITLNTTPNALANGAYSVSIAAGAVLGVNGRPVQPFTTSFVVNDTIAPRIVATNFNGRYVTIQFSESMRASTITASSIVLASPGQPNLNLDPRYLVGYDEATRLAIIDLTNVPQSLLQGGGYTLIVHDIVTDVVGNRLDGEVNSSMTIFPSGNGLAGGSFLQNRAFNLQAPLFNNLTLAAATDTGIVGDSITALTQPTFSGQVTGLFPSATAGLLVAIQFSGLRGGVFDLVQGPGGRGYSGSPDLIVTTDAFGRFTFTAPAALAEGFQLVRTIVVGQADQAPLAGLSRQFETSFRIDRTAPTVKANTVIANGDPASTLDRTLSTLTSIAFDVQDAILPASGALAVPGTFNTPAIDPTSASNVSNYRLINLGPDGQGGGGDDVDLSSYILEARYVPGTRDAFGSQGRIELRLANGLPAGKYIFVARTAGVNVPGIRDISGNALDGDPNTPGLQDFQAFFDIQPTPTYITKVDVLSPNSNSPDGFDHTGRAGEYFEVGGTRASAPPAMFHIDFSNRLPAGDYSNAVQLLRSANNGGASDGDFGPSDGSNPSFNTLVPVNVLLIDTVTGLYQGQPGFETGNRLVVVPQNSNLPPDYYRLVLPNSGANATIRDIYGNQLDGEFMGNINPTNSGYETLLPTGQIRGGYSGDGTNGGAFQFGYVVVPSGNVLFARADGLDDPNVTNGLPDGSAERPYTTLAPEGDPTYTFASDPSNAFSGLANLNDVRNYGTFTTARDRNGNGKFDLSAFAAAQLRSQFGPVVIVAQASLLDASKTFVLAPGLGTTGTARDASASVPYGTSLVFQAGSVLKMNSASLFVQNQGSAVQFRGSATNPALVTSYLDDTIGGDTNRDGAGSQPAGGDYGGIVFRNYDQSLAGRAAIAFPVDGALKGTLGANGAFALATGGADEALSIIDHTIFRYGGGPVPQGFGTRYDTIHLINSRAQVSNTLIGSSGLAGGTTAQAGISGDLDSFREDDLYRGPLVRNVGIFNTSINGIFVRPNESSGTIEQTNARNYVVNSAAEGGSRNITFTYGTLPYVVGGQIFIGAEQNVVSLQQSSVPNRLYVDPGTLVKFLVGAGITVSSGEGALPNRNASFIAGDRTYIRRFDADNTYNPLTSANFEYNKNAAHPVFTSIHDDVTSTSFTDPRTNLTTTLVPANDAGNDGVGVGTPLAPGAAVDFKKRWGSIEVASGAFAVIDQADFRFGGGIINFQDLTLDAQSVLTLSGAGARVMVTNNNFYDNFDAAMQIDTDGLFAAPATTIGGVSVPAAMRPLASFHPYFRGNVMQRNDIDGLAVVANRGALYEGSSFTNLIRNVEAGQPANSNQPTVSVDTLWDSTDLSYVLRGSVVLATGTPKQLPGTTLQAQQTAGLTLTIQSALPSTLLADGTRINAQGESVIVKLRNDFAPQGAGALGTFGSTGGGSNTNVGAGFAVGVDNNADPTAQALVDPGVNSQIRIVGIGGNETIGQRRVPVIITSLRDGTAGTRVRGVDMFNIYNREPLAPGASLTTPAAGDGGMLYFGGNSLFDYNLYDTRDGNIIDNADIRYMTRIEIQGGGIVDAFDVNGNASLDGFPDNFDGWRGQKLGTASPLNQFNSAQAMTISNSNLRSMADAAVFAHPNAGNAIVRNVGAGLLNNVGTGGTFRSGLRGQGYVLNLYNNTIANSPIGVRLTSETGNGLGQGDTGQSPEQVLMLNNTFFNNGIGLDTESPQFNGNNNLSHVSWLAMNNVFANSTTLAIRAVGQQAFSQAQYNLFTGNSNDLSITTNNADFGGNFGAIFGGVDFVDPANFNFNLRSGSGGIDAARAQMGPLTIGDALAPIAVQSLTATPGLRNTTGRSNVNGGFGTVVDPREMIYLPGSLSNNRLYRDQFVNVPAGTPGAVAGPLTATTGVFYLPIAGERDQNGYLRQDDPDVNNLGFGNPPFFDMGSFEYRDLNPPKVEAVTASLADGSIRSLYVPNGIGGVNQTPQSINVRFNRPIDLATLNSSTVLLVQAGADRLLNTPDDVKINLAGKFVYNTANFTLTINLGAAGLSLASDLFQLQLLGDGGTVVRDITGTPLDGENVDGTGAQLPLPSGDDFPGGDFRMTFTVNTSTPIPVAGTFTLDPSTDTGPRDFITRNNTPTFTGQVSDQFPPVNPLINQTAIIDISTRGDGIFDLLNAGIGTTDANGNFRVALTTAIPDSPRNVGPDGILGTADDLGFTLARVRFINTSGNASNPDDPNARLKLWVDTASPALVSATPADDSLVTPTSNALPITMQVSENLNLASLATGVVVVRSGGDGVFGNGNDVQMTIDTSSITVSLLYTPSGAMTVNFNAIDPSGTLPNDIYRVFFLGTGASPVTDVAGNGIDAAGIGGPSDLVNTITVFSPTVARYIFVDGGYFGPSDGTRNSPFRTIQAGINAANVGDVVAVLPPSGSLSGPPDDYTESITLKSEVKVVSADPTSTQTILVRGSALNTVIRAPDGATPVTVSGNDLISVPGLQTEISGFTIAGPLVGNQANGPINASSIGLLLVNSDVLVSNNYFITANQAILAQAGGVDTAFPQIVGNVVAGNNTGISLLDTGVASYRTGSPARVYNNTVAFNTVGLAVFGSGNGQTVADVANNIFASNNDRTAARNGFAVVATTPDQTLLRFNMFFDNSASSASPADDVAGVGNGFNSAALGANPDSFGNFVGNPQFVKARDPRPNFDGPGFFYADGNFGLRSTSAAIDNALNALAPATDFLGRGRVLASTSAFPGRGPADIGAFEFGGTGGSAIGGSFRVVSSSLTPDGSALAGGLSLGRADSAPNQITVVFSRGVDRSSVVAGDLILSGSGIDPANPAHAVGVVWINDYTAVFTIAGKFVPGEVAYTINSGGITDVYGTAMAAFADSVRLEANPAGTPVPAPTPTGPVAPTNPRAARRAAREQAQRERQQARREAERLRRQAQQARKLAQKQAQKARRQAAAKRAAERQAARRLANRGNVVVRVASATPAGPMALNRAGAARLTA